MKRVHLIIVMCLLVMGPMFGTPEHKSTDSIIQVTASPVIEDRESYYLHKVRSSRSRPLVTKKPVTAKPVKDAWWRVALCESSGNPKKVNRTGKYRGAFQFDLPTFHADPVNLPGDPINYSYEVQKAAAKRLYAERGSSPWPECGRYLR